MKILKTIKSISLAVLLFVAQKAFAQSGESPDINIEYGMPVRNGWALAGSLITFCAVIAVFVGTIISPILGYRWYIKHGGTRKWLKWFAYLPLVTVIFIIVLWMVILG